MSSGVTDRGTWRLVARRDFWVRIRERSFLISTLINIAVISILVSPYWKTVSITPPATASSSSAVNDLTSWLFVFMVFSLLRVERTSTSVLPHRHMRGWTQ